MSAGDKVRVDLISHKEYNHLEAVGWYKIADIQMDDVSRGKFYFLHLGRQYNHSNSESYAILITTAYCSCDMKLLSKRVQSYGFTNVSVYLNSDYTMSVYAYYSTTINNHCNVGIYSSFYDYSVKPFEATTPTGTLLYGLDLSKGTTCDDLVNYLPLSGGTMSGPISWPGVSVSWMNGRDSARVKTTSANGYGALASIKTTNGDWAIGHYNYSGYHDKLTFSYVSDTNHNAGNNAASTYTLDSSGNFSGNAAYATSAGSATTATTATNAVNADTVDGHHFHWSGQGGQPTWLWGGNDSTDMYIYNPANFSVNYATSAGSIPLNKYYPVGAIYWSYSSTSPASLFGGTWTQITSRFLYAYSSAGLTGGASTVTLTLSQIPSHTHSTPNAATVGEGGTPALESWGSTYGDSRSLPTGAAGGGGAHENMPPYLTVYCWRRTA